MTLVQSSPVPADVLAERLGGQTRLTELRETSGLSETAFRAGLFSLIERGEVAVFPVGDVVSVRKEN